jgi:N-acylneuraminate cytidylyltransferase
MKNVAFIPVRGGSKSVPMKNIKIIHGKPLVYWTARAACLCPYIDNVYICTDSDRIRDTVDAFCTGPERALFSKLIVIGRSADSASDTASTESVMLEFATERSFDNIVLVQATSPLLVAEDLSRGFEAFFAADTDGVLSVVRQKRFHWKCDEWGYAYPTNYDVFHRPRRQDFDGDLVENGAFYITARTDLLRTGNRISGNIRAVEMDESTYFEIDEPSDWLIIEELMKKRSAATPLADWSDIKMVLSDCDGCLTDGGMYYGEFGDELKKFNTRDGVGFSMLRARGIVTGIITSESMELNRRRATKMNLDVVEMGSFDKVETVGRVCRERGIALRNVAYVGDDVNDVELLKLVGLGFCPADAVKAAKEASGLVARACGGQGVIRELAEMLLENL